MGKHPDCKLEPRKRGGQIFLEPEEYAALLEVAEDIFEEWRDDPGDSVSKRLSLLMFHALRSQEGLNKWRELKEEREG